MEKFLKIYNNAITIIVLAILGGFCGYIFGDKIFFLKPFGDLFINLIKMLIVPVVFFTVINATSNLNSHSNAVSLGGFTLIYYLCASTISGLLGVLLAYYLEPGIGVMKLPQEFLTLPKELQNVAASTNVGVWDFIFGMIPNNPIKALTEGNLLPILFFAIFVGVGISYSQNKNKDTLIKTIDAGSDIFMWMVKKIMFLAPIAVFCLIAYLVGSIGIEVVYLVAKLFLVIIIGLLIWVYVFLGGIASIFSNGSYFKFVKTIIPLQILAFGTSSSLVCLPKNMEVSEKLGASKEINNFVLPIGTTLHMNGSALYYSVVTVFFAQMFGVPLDFYTYILIAFTAALGAMATPGVPGLSLTIVMVLLVANVPLIGLPLIIAIDRILDMFITTTNVLGNTVYTTVAQRIFGKKS
ncbi:MAG: dicarboxylate/amino acid:cation symporter [Alphaproteobacteria bacterium]|jgi:Na+/H+-dicarboxylate symporter|nr:dicarboxylate/amino acid:cation symporter [Alphaproteobacteria bacterium]